MLRFKTFLSDRKGHTSIIFGLSAVPLIMSLSLGVDYNQALSHKTVIQNALDSTVLMAAREAPRQSDAELAKLSKAYFRAMLEKNPDITVSDPVLVKTDKHVSLSVSGSSPIHFGQFFGMDKWDLALSAQAGFATRKIELALVLDNTGSMASRNKLTELKKASNSLLDILEKSARKPDQIKVALVPYTTRVRLDVALRDQNWLTNTPSGAPLPSGAYGYKLPASRLNWQGCVADRDKGFNNSTNPFEAGNHASKYPMVDCAYGPVAIMPLTANWSALRTRIGEMKADGNTNIALGAQWGYEMLSGAAPFAEASGDADTERFMILLTDGLNTQDRWNNSESAMNNDTRAMCDAITERGVAEAAKKLRIKLYTVLVIEGNETLLKNCASNPSMFKYVKDASELNKVFKDIADEISQIRLTM
ncbi:MAG: pilus assembly protein [Proteobacteria bacterium]|nr:pilus assembly protein [Pseudomonadota bacterium]